MESPPIFNLSFFDLAGNPLTVPGEWRTAWIKIGIAQQNWEHVRLVRQMGEELPVSLRHLGGNTYVVAEWPLSGPGHYRLQLYIYDKLVAVEPSVITIQSGKISNQAYGQLLEDLVTYLPASIALALQRHGAFANLSFLPPLESTLATELTRLERAIRGTTGRIGLAQALSALASQPYILRAFPTSCGVVRLRRMTFQVLNTQELWVQRERARRPHPARIVQAMASRHNLDKDGEPVRVLDTRVEHTVDVYENRLLKVFWQQVHLRLRRLQSVLGRLEQQSSGRDLLKKARDLDIALHYARCKATFLNEVTLPPHLPAQITMLLLQNPLYRAVLEGYLELHRSPVVYLKEPALEAPLENLPFLYQVWGTLQVLNTLLEETKKMGYRVAKHELAKRDEHGVYLKLLPDNEKLVVLEHPADHTIIRFISERTYGKASKQGMQSISFEQRPDVAVEILTPDKPPRIYLFDPKYKLSGDAENGKATPKKEDIDKMHAYRDAIRDQEQRRAVNYAAILYPGPYQHYYDGLEALQAYPGSQLSLEEHLKDIFRVALQI